MATDEQRERALREQAEDRLDAKHGGRHVPFEPSEFEPHTDAQINAEVKAIKRERERGL